MESKDMDNVKTFIPEIHPEIAEMQENGAFQIGLDALAGQAVDPDHMRTPEWASRIKEALKAGRFEIGGIQTEPPELAALAPDTEVVLRHGGTDSLVSAGVALAMIRDITERQANGQFEFGEVVQVLESLTGDRDTWPRVQKAFDAGELRFWRNGFTVDPAAQDMPLMYGEATTAAEIQRWLKDSGATVQWPKRIKTLPAQRNTSDGRTWQEIAREIATEYAVHNDAMGCHPALKTIADHVARVLQERGVFGPQGGPLSGGTVMREALQGGKWPRPHRKK